MTVVLFLTENVVFSRIFLQYVNCNVLNLTLEFMMLIVGGLDNSSKNVEIKCQLISKLSMVILLVRFKWRKTLGDGLGRSINKFRPTGESTVSMHTSLRFVKSFFFEYLLEVHRKGIM